MKNLKIISLLFILPISCKNKSVKEDISERFPNYKIDTILNFDFDNNQIPDNICVLDLLSKKRSTFDNKQAILLYMNDEFVSKNDNVLPKSVAGWEHLISFKNKNNEFVIDDEFSTSNPRASYRLVFVYNKSKKKVLLDSFIIDGKREDEKGMPYFKNISKKKIPKNQIFSIDKENFLTKDSLDYKNF